MPKPNTGLTKWFNEQWVDISRTVDGKHPPCGRSKANKSKKEYPVCRPKAVADKMSKGQKVYRTKKKRSLPQGIGGKPTRVGVRQSLALYYVEAKNIPNDPKLWAKAQSLAKKKFKVHPSAYSNGFAAKWYKSKGGTWRVEK